MGLLLSGCNKTPTASCSSTDTQNSMGKLLIEKVEKITADKVDDGDAYLFDKAKIRASLAQVKVAIEGIRTVKEDPNSSKKFCSGLLKVTIPTSMLADVDQARAMQDKLKISEYARQVNIDNSINVFTQNDVEYNVQPTDDGKELYVELENYLWVNFLDQLITSDLLKPLLEVQKAEQIKKNEQAKQELIRLNQEAEQARLEVEKLRATQEKQASENLKNELLQEQLPQRLAAPSSAGTPQMMVMQMLEYALNDGGLSREPEIQQAKLQIESLPKPAKGNKKAARAINDKGLALAKAYDFDNAAKMFWEAYQLDSSDVEIIGNLGFAYLKQGNLEYAQQAIINALILSPGRASTWANLGEMFGASGDMAKAAACFSNTYRFSKDRSKTLNAMRKLNATENIENVRQARAKAIEWAEKAYPNI